MKIPISLRRAVRLRTCLLGQSREPDNQNAGRLEHKVIGLRCVSVIGLLMAVLLPPVRPLPEWTRERADGGWVWVWVWANAISLSRLYLPWLLLLFNSLRSALRNGFSKATRVWPMDILYSPLSNGCLYHINLVKMLDFSNRSSLSSVTGRDVTARGNTDT